MFRVECYFVAIALLGGFAFPRFGGTWLARCERTFAKLAERRELGVAVVVLSTLLTRLLLLPFLGVPEPGVHDEFGYLLLGDTFAHGRLTNPAHPMWVHFESFHIIWQPTYTAMFYPAQGLVLALGQVAFGHPFWGVWLSAGLMCGAICWMLQGWLPPRWALLGGFLAATRLGIFSYWANSYWGGAVAAIGGALVLGALPRLRQSSKLRDAVLMGLGFALIASSRPYEGLFFSVPVLAALLSWLFRLKAPPLRLAAARVIFPLLAIALLTAGAMGYYFWRTTGSFWTPPYLVNMRAYNPVPYFPWQQLHPIPVYRHADIRGFYLSMALRRYELSHSLRGMLGIQFVGLAQAWSFFLGPVLSLPFMVALTTLPYGFSPGRISHRTRFLLVVCVAVLLGSMLPIWSNPHYIAPITCAIWALVLIAMRRIRTLEWRGRPTGVFLTRAVPAICVVLAILHIIAGSSRAFACPAWPSGQSTEPTWCSPSPANTERAGVLARLESYPGRQLAIVHYGPDHDLYFHEWVYNPADIETARVVFARDMGPVRNLELIDYFKDRHVWLVDADATAVKLEPYDLAPTGNQRASERSPERP
ncbi:MAG TPA: hypothetical protein VGZ29_04105 [Terriglobia bacterium]|nr:hypothetical protein [Terriglobia bacterium]